MHQEENSSVRRFDIQSLFRKRLTCGADRRVQTNQRQTNFGEVMCLVLHKDEGVIGLYAEVLR